MNTTKPEIITNHPSINSLKNTITGNIRMRIYSLFLNQIKDDFFGLCLRISTFFVLKIVNFNEKLKILLMTRDNVAPKTKNPLRIFIKHYECSLKSQMIKV
ncbi:hypothetical protein RYX36_029876 [Vicia faba]